MTMQPFVRNALIGTALLGAAGLVTSTLPASAAVSATVAENPVLKSQDIVHLAQEVWDPSKGSVGFGSRRSNPTLKTKAQRQSNDGMRPAQIGQGVLCSTSSAAASNTSL